MNDFVTEQESFWAGKFGDEYTTRNQGKQLIASNTALFSQVLSHTKGVNSVIEFGANQGLNLQVIRSLLPVAELTAVEINESASSKLYTLGYVRVHHQSILDFIPESLHDLVLIKGVLIHIKPDCLPLVYDLLYNASGRYVCIVEYYNPTPIEVQYRGHTDKLFKRDFAGEMLTRFPDLRLVNYGFVYHGDINFPLDDVTWFLLGKREV